MKSSGVYAGVIVAFCAALPTAAEDLEIGSQPAGVTKMVDPGWSLRRSHDLIESRTLLTDAMPEPSPRTLRKMVDTSLKRSDALEAARSRAEADAYAAEAEQARLLPSVSLSASRDYQMRPGSSYASSATAIRDRAVISAEWTVFSSGANWSAIKARRLTAEATAYGYLAAERQALLEHLDVYLKTVSARKLVATIGTTLRRLQEIRRSTRSRFEAELASRTDLAQIDAEISAGKAELEAAKSLRERQEIAYRDLTGSAPPATLAMPNPGRHLPAKRAALMQRALFGNIALAEAGASAAAAEADRAAVKGEYLPRLSIYGSTELSDGDDRDFEDSDWQVGIKLSVPLVDFAAMPRYREASARAAASRYTMRDTDRRLRRELATNWERYHAAKRQRKQRLRQLTALRRSADGLKKEVEAGLRPIDDLLRAEIELIEAKIEADNTELDGVTAAYRMLAHISDISLAEILP